MLADTTETSSKTADGPLSETVESVLSAADRSDDALSVGEIIEAAGDKGALPPILLVALIAATPLSGIPGVSVVCGLVIALLSFELIANFRSLHLPGKLKRASIDPDKLSRAIRKIEPALRWIDRHTGDRLKFLFHRPVIWVPQILCLLSGLAMPFLEFVPFSSSVVAAGVCLLVMAMLTRDGIFVVLALIPYGGLIYLLMRVLG
ncbi:exopolysaccharide biosynthesis protein [Roseovarius spongiae]|uniref:Exopolysaccharide biosynthesis protein n=1 Tax=Roseovarius spongiae TaxID=2320272 RepID=A0A3A8AUW4_9RHOB|nr:exopolysaccharide biosynthesis protein [Roseovarius spongiae]RKF12719.1 exopolysaccharide biosynthesis protein [Roseovarius spongiae]